MVLFMIQAREVAIIGPASFGSRHEMLSRPEALSADNLPSNFKTSVAEVKTINVNESFAFSPAKSIYLGITRNMDYRV